MPHRYHQLGIFEGSTHHGLDADPKVLKALKCSRVASTGVPACHEEGIFSHACIYFSLAFHRHGQAFHIWGSTTRTPTDAVHGLW